MGTHRGERHGERRDGARQSRREPGTIPHDEIAEQTVIGTLLAFGEEHGGGMMRSAIAAGVSHASFFAVSARAVWCEIEALVAEGKMPGALPVMLKLHEAGTLDAAGGAAAVEKITNDIAVRCSSWATAREAFVSALLTLRRKEIDREVQGRARALADAVSADDHEAVSDQARKLAELVGKRTRANELPAIMGWNEFVMTDRPKPQELVTGVLHRGAKMMLGGGSKSFKTWCLLDLGLAVATGRPWWGIRTEQAPVLYVNFELQVEFCQERVREISKAKEIAEAPEFYSWHLRGYARDLADLVPVFMSRMNGTKIGLIILDPIYKALGERDENSNGEVAQLLNEVEALAVRTGAAVAFGHHFSKGNQAAKTSQDRVSGAGSWARDPDALITLTPHEEESCFAAEFTLRNCKQREPFVLRWTHPVMQSAPGLSPTALREPGRPKEHTADKLMDVLGNDSLTFATWSEKCERRGVSKSTFKRLLQAAKEAGKIKQVGTLYERA